MATPSPTDNGLRELRKALRARRRAVPEAERRRAARHLAWQVERAGWLSGRRRIGIFLTMAEEIDTTPLRARALARGCTLFVPRVTDYRRNRMQFLPLTGPMRRGNYGILEPGAGVARSLRRLDVVFMPLVGFDRHGNRIGMGKGYYDRALAFRRRQKCWKQPLLVGLAFECQRVEALPTQAHDIPLDRIVTDAATRRFPA